MVNVHQHQKGEREGEGWGVLGFRPLSYRNEKQNCDNATSRSLVICESLVLTKSSLLLGTSNINCS